MGPGDSPKRRYAELIVKIGLGVPIYEGEIDALPDPDLFRDAWMLAQWGTWSPRDLDETDALLLNVVNRIKRAITKRQR